MCALTVRLCSGYEQKSHCRRQFLWIFARDCEGTEQLQIIAVQDISVTITQTEIPERQNELSKWKNNRKNLRLFFCVFLHII